MIRSTHLTTAFACAAMIFAAMPAAQAASRSVEFSQTVFQNRCLAQGGSIHTGASTILCQTAEIEVRCDFVEINLAECNWAGIDNKPSVNRIIGMASAEALSGEEGGPGAGRPRWRNKVIRF